MDLEVSGRRGFKRFFLGLFGLVIGGGFLYAAFTQGEGILFGLFFGGVGLLIGWGGAISVVTSVRPVVLYIKSSGSVLEIREQDFRVGVDMGEVKRMWISVHSTNFIKNEVSLRYLRYGMSGESVFFDFYSSANLDEDDVAAILMMIAKEFPQVEYGFLS